MTRNRFLAFILTAILSTALFALPIHACQACLDDAFAMQRYLEANPTPIVFHRIELDIPDQGIWLDQLLNSFELSYDDVIFFTEEILTTVANIAYTKGISVDNLFIASVIVTDYNDFDNAERSICIHNWTFQGSSISHRAYSCSNYCWMVTTTSYYRCSNAGCFWTRTVRTYTGPMHNFAWFIVGNQIFFRCLECGHER
ncbi:MAG: hypothetical protein FWC95_05390 [Defluviitaleaceae bacterium]|nr:hypothetical protein [Defluviitaleaceae bacterium]